MSQSQPSDIPERKPPLRPSVNVFLSALLFYALAVLFFLAFDGTGPVEVGRSGSPGFELFILLIYLLGGRWLVGGVLAFIGTFVLVGGIKGWFR